MKQIILDGKRMLVEYSEQGGVGKSITFVDGDVEVIIKVDSFDYFMNTVNMTDDLWHGRGKE
jgi:hypothetical protein